MVPRSKYNSVNCTECGEKNKKKGWNEKKVCYSVLQKETTEQKKEENGGRWASVERRAAAAAGTACRRRAVSEGNGDSLSRVGNEVSVVI